MNHFYKISVCIIAFIFCFLSYAGKVTEQAYQPVKIPAEIQKNIPENIDFIGVVEATGLPIILMKKNIRREMKKHFYLEQIKFSDILNRYYIFGSTEHGYCGILVLSSGQNAKGLFQSLSARLKKKDGTSKVSENFAVSEKEKLFFKLLSDDILLISINETNPERYASKNPAPIIEKLEFLHMAELYCKGDPKKIPIVRNYISTVPDIPGFKEARMAFNIIAMCLNAEFVFPTQEDAEKSLLVLEHFQKKISSKYPTFSLTFDRKICNDTIKLTFSDQFFLLMKRIVKDPDFQLLLQKKQSKKDL